MSYDYFVIFKLETIKVAFESIFSFLRSLCSRSSSSVVGYGSLYKCKCLFIITFDLNFDYLTIEESIPQRVALCSFRKKKKIQPATATEIRTKNMQCHVSECV